MTKKQKKSLIALLIILAVLSVGYFAIIRPLVNKSEGQTPSTPLDLMEGEAYYYNQGYRDTLRVLFPQFSRADLYMINVHNDDTNYQFLHWISDASSDAENYFMLGQDSNGDGKSELYAPDIASLYPAFEYSSLYDDTSKIPTVISVTGACFFKDRVYIRQQDPANPTYEEYQTILAKYGLSDADTPAYYEISGYAIDKAHNVIYYYVDEVLGYEYSRMVYQRIDSKGNVTYYTLTSDEHAWNEELQAYDFENYGALYTGSLDELYPVVDQTRSYKVYVGDRTPDRTGYYLRVDGRDIVYTTGTSDIGNVVNKDLPYFVNPRIMALSEEVFAPYMPIDFGIWTKGEMLDRIVSGAGVTYFASDILMNGESIGSESGMIHMLKGKVDDRLYSALLGKAVADKVDVLIPEKIPLYSPIAVESSVEYVFYSIDGILSGDTTVRTEGAIVSEDDTVLLTYRLCEGETMGELYNGAVDLTDPTVPDSIKAALIGRAVGGDKTGATELCRAEVVFNSSYADTFTEVYKIAQIIGFASNESLSDLNSITNAALPSTGYALIYCTVEVDGVIDGRELVINLEHEDSYMREQIRLALRGKANGVQKNLAVSAEYAYSPVLAYTLYEDLEVVSINAFNEELSFEFVNELYRDKFHGSTSLYEITGPVDRTMYTLDPDATKNVMMNFADLVGTETLAVGLNADVIREYGLDAHIFYFDYPFVIGEDKEDGNEAIVTYTYAYTLKYCIYVSEQKDGFYYVANTMYDTVVKVGAELFDFVDWDFSGKWMYKTIMQLSIYDIAELTFDINFTDLKEAHSFVLTTNPSYYVYAGINSYGEEEWAEQKRVYASYIKGDTINYETLTVAEGKVVLDNRLYTKDDPRYYTKAGMLVSKKGSHYLVTRVTNGINLDQVYLDKTGSAVNYSYDFEGVYNLKNMLLKVYSTAYSGSVGADLSESELSALLADSDNRIFNIRMKMTDGREFNVGFYRYTDGRCLVRFSDETTGAVSTELYLNTFEVKGLVSAVRALANGEQVPTNESWIPDVE